MNRFFALALPATIVIAAPALAAAMTPKEYLMVAGASDLFERQSAQLVLETTGNPKIRSFATMMIRMHTQSTMEVKAAAAKAKIAVAPPMLSPAQMEMMAQLRAVSGKARDDLYIAQQRAAHGGALSVQQAYAAGGTVPALRMAAAKIVPVVKQHIAMLMTM